jgi:multicomponent Na+:H+ antiporter subunit D
MSQAIPLFVILPLLAAFTAAMAGTRLGIYGKGTVSLLFLLLSALGVVMLLDGQGDPRVYKVGGWEDVSGIPIAIYMVADPLSLIMLLIINTIAAAASAMRWPTWRPTRTIPNFMCCSASWRPA